MKKTRCLALTMILTAPLLCVAETWTNASLVDSSCSAKVKADPDSHTRACALQCAQSGFGIITADGTYLRFDAAGDRQAIAALKTSHQKDHLRTNVTGDREGNTIKVKSLKL